MTNDEISYADEVERCYGVRPTMRDEEEFERAHRRLDEVLPGSGPLAERFVTWREAQAIPPDKLRAVIDSLADAASGATDHPAPADDLAVRRLDDGREFTIVKVFHPPDELRAALDAAGFSDLDLTTTGRFFILGTSTAA